MKLEDIMVMKEFLDVFSEDFSGLPPAREIDFSIYLTLGTGPITRASYRMALVELKEMKEHLIRGLFDRVFHLGKHEFCLLRIKMGV